MYRKRKRPTPGLGIQPPYNPIRGDYADLRKEGIVSRVAIMRVLEIKDDYLVCCGYDPESMRFLNSVNVAKPYLCRTTLADEFVSHSQTRNYFEGELIVAVKPRTALGDTPGQAIDPQELDDFGYSRYEVMLDEEDNPIWWMELAGGGGGGGDSIIGKLDGAITATGSATLSIWTGTPGSESDSGKNETVYNWAAGALDSGTKVVATKISDHYYLTGILPKTTEITVQTAEQWNGTAHKLQKKSRTAKVLDPGSESDWTDIDTADCAASC